GDDFIRGARHVVGTGSSGRGDVGDNCLVFAAAKAFDFRIKLLRDANAASRRIDVEQNGPNRRRIFVSLELIQNGARFEQLPFNIHDLDAIRETKLGPVTGAEGQENGQQGDTHKHKGSS